MEGGLVSSCAVVVGADVSQALGHISGATSQGAEVGVSQSRFV